jgi:hypothetical protein
MFKRILIVAVLAVGGSLALAPQADAGVFVRRIAPVRRVAARAVLPPYPIARRAVVGPVIGPVYRPYVSPLYRPVVVGAPMVYGPSIVVGY